MKEIWERLQYLLDTFNVSNQEFEKKAKLSNDYLKKTINNQGKPSRRILNQILEAYPTVNPEWLRYGRGPVMLGTSLKDEWQETAEYKLLISIKSQIEQKEDINVDILKAAYLALFERFNGLVDELSKQEGDI
jgi:hypothetical protein